MKKTLLTIAMCFFVLGLVAQEERNIMLSDQQVVPPKFKGVEPVVKEEVKQSPICCYLQENLELEVPINDYLPEGTVAIEFTINRDGTLSNFTVTNRVNYTLEQAVIACIKETEGMWQPGEVNGQPSPMEKRVYVRFDNPDNESFEQIARDHYLVALKRFKKGMYIEDNQLLSTNQRKRKSQRLFNSSLNQLDIATVYMPNDPTIAFWKARNYEELGMHKDMINMLEKRRELLSMKLSERELKNHYDLAIITLK
ncbi:energy transducer TonB [Carboxylicivirga mesophila]|uniref:Energy transducer TonB n=1 Tax=Carboxylicivirga mesophila TaxID=1166478 RepID=A0ABS5KBA3_9BACT|nr:energy transducer TonB [Carboxylicivirga mesophila]MBS2211808.1 energy transducer TonB [Carboxylicivirga mesophila]